MSPPSQIKSLEDNFRLVGKYARVIAGAGLPYYIAFFGVKWALPTRPVIALIVSFITLMIAVWIAVQLCRFIKHSIPTTIAIVGLFVASTYASTFAGLSATIHIWRATSYTVTASPSLVPTSGKISDVISVEDLFGIFSQYYTVVLLDLMPGIEFSKTFALPDSVEIKSRIGGLPVLGFKIPVIFAIVGAFKKWREIRKK
jgi:hypothetical protein